MGRRQQWEVRVRKVFLDWGGWGREIPPWRQKSAELGRTWAGAELC